MSHFAFLQPEWPALFEAASKAEALALPDPRTSCFYARRSLELVVLRGQERLTEGRELALKDQLRELPSNA
jgi:type I restriction enzyme R subunit